MTVIVAVTRAAKLVPSPLSAPITSYCTDVTSAGTVHCWTAAPWAVNVTVTGAATSALGGGAADVTRPHGQEHAAEHQRRNDQANATDSGFRSGTHRRSLAVPSASPEQRCRLRIDGRSTRTVPGLTPRRARPCHVLHHLTPRGIEWSQNSWNSGASDMPEHVRQTGTCRTRTDGARRADTRLARCTARDGRRHTTLMRLFGARRPQSVAWSTAPSRSA